MYTELDLFEANSIRKSFYLESEDFEDTLTQYRRQMDSVESDIVAWKEMDKNDRTLSNITKLMVETLQHQYHNMMKLYDELCQHQKTIWLKEDMIKIHNKKKGD